MKDDRTSFTGFNPFAPSERRGSSFGSGSGPVSGRKRYAELGAGLQAAYSELLEAPLPERLARLIEQLDASSQESAR